MTSTMSTREFFIPTPSIKISDKNSDAVAYIYVNNSGSPCAAVFWGKRSRPEWDYHFASEDKRTASIVKSFSLRQQATDRKATAAKKRQAATRGVEVGHILYTSWGYEQTNINYYEVTALKGEKTAEVRKIGTKNAGEPGGRTGYCVPDIGNYLGKPKQVLIRNACASIEGRHATLWNNKPNYKTNLH